MIVELGTVRERTTIVYVTAIYDGGTFPNDKRV